MYGNFITFVVGLALKYGAKKYITSKILSTVVSYVATSLILKGANEILSHSKIQEIQIVVKIV